MKWQAVHGPLPRDADLHWAGIQILADHACLYWARHSMPGRDPGGGLYYDAHPIEQMHNQLTMLASPSSQVERRRIRRLKVIREGGYRIRPGWSACGRHVLS